MSRVYASFRSRQAGGSVSIQELSTIFEMVVVT